MQKKVKSSGLSIRYKLMLMLVTLPVITLSLYLILATRLFESDKIAYVYDTTSTVTRNMSNQVRERIEGVVKEVAVILSSKSLQTSKVLFDQYPNILRVDRLSKGKTQLSLSKKEFQSEAMIRDRYGSYLKAFEAQVKRGETFFKVLRASDGLSIVGLKGGAETVFALFKIEDIAKVFQKKSYFSVYLLDTEGAILLGPKDSQQDLMGETQGFRHWDFFEKLLKQSLPGGTVETASPTGIEVLVSYARLGSSPQMVLTVVEKRLALSAVDALIIKSLLFFVALISGATIVSVFAARKLTAQLTKLSKSTERVAQGDFDIQIEPETNDEVGQLALSFNHMAAEVKRLMKETADKARMEKELEMAKTVQSTLFPADEAQIGPIRINGYYEQASETGGDWWYYGEIGDQLFLWIGDATGHGVPAALVTAAAKSAATLLEKFSKLTPGKALTHLNRSVYSTTRGGVMMTFFVASIDRKTGRLTYASASHDPPFLIRKTDGEVKKRDLIPLNEKVNVRLAEKADTVYEDCVLQLEEGDQIVLYTDGVFDVVNGEGKAFGEKNFQKLLAATRNQTKENKVFMESIRKTLTDYRGNNELIDDITFFTCQYQGKDAA